MLEPWNGSTILPPPVCTCLCNHSSDVSDLTYTCKEILKVLSKQSPLHLEAAVISRFIYKFDKKFRNDIGYRNLKKVNVALKKYLSLNLYKIIDNLLNFLPAVKSDELYMPSLQMLQYVLVRIQTFAKIMLRVNVTSKQAGVFYLDRVKRGEGHWMSLMPYAVLCRVWSMSSILIKHSCTWYGNLYSFLSKLQPVGLLFLPSNYELPSDLRKWLDIDNVDNMGRFEWKENKIVEVSSFLSIPEDSDEFDIYQYVKNINEEDKTEKVKDNHKPSINVCEIKPSLGKYDAGQLISRDAFKMMTLNSTEISKSYTEMKNENRATSDNILKIEKKCGMTKKITEQKESVSKHCIENVTGNKTLALFLSNEEKYRNNSSDCSLTNHLSFMQWQSLKATLSKLCDPLNNNRKIQRKFMKIWNDKCLSYKDETE